METTAQSAENTTPVRGRPWLPGQSGNPGGRPKGYAEFRAACQAASPAAVRALRAALKDGKLSVQAASEILDRAWGKAEQRVDHAVAVISYVVTAPAGVTGALDWQNQFASPPQIEAHPSPSDKSS